jgi:hypothetical protein
MPRRERRQDVIAEKPLGTGSEDTGTLAAVCFNYRHYPVVQQLRAMVRSSEYGPVVESGTFRASPDGRHQPVHVASVDFGTVMIRFAGGARGALVIESIIESHRSGSWIARCASPAMTT